jgi:hypothetical protein
MPRSGIGATPVADSDPVTGVRNRAVITTGGAPVIVRVPRDGI